MLNETQQQSELLKFYEDYTCQVQELSQINKRLEQTLIRLRGENEPLIAKDSVEPVKNCFFATLQDMKFQHNDISKRIYNQVDEIEKLIM